MPEVDPSAPALTVMSGPLKGARLVLTDVVDEILIGSDPECRFCLDLPTVSPIHARLWLDLGGATIFDTRSPQGIYVNDARVEDQVPLQDGDVVWLGPPGDDGSVMIQCQLGGLPAAPVAASGGEAVPEHSPPE